MINQVASGKNLLVLGFESAHHPVSWPMTQALEIARAAGGESSEPIESDAENAGAKSEKSARAALAQNWRQAFIEAPYRFAALASIGVVVDTFETACTWDRFDELHRQVIAAVRDAMKTECGGGVVTCRFTHVYPDGPAPYYTFIAPGRAAEHSGDWVKSRLAQCASIKSAASEAVLRAGGTITHHHAVGRTHRPWYDRQRPELFAEVLRAAKKSLDPAGILNPGVLID